MKYKLLAVVCVAIALAIVVLQCASRHLGSSDKRGELVLAIRHAQSMLRPLRNRIEHPQAGDQAFFIRASFTDHNGRKVLLWLKHAEIAPGGFKGVVDEDPFDLADIHRGDIVTVATDDVVDWTILHADGTHEGGFTQGLEPGS
ncbi:MAG TPA: DUF2314 domain-containing protein [Fimbriimonadaceae bacterium]|nr:DUF2314 domain-containing protein [Fimbriimonadaceae bacterium]